MHLNCLHQLHNKKSFFDFFYFLFVRKIKNGLARCLPAKPALSKVKTQKLGIFNFFYCIADVANYGLSRLESCCVLEELFRLYIRAVQNHLTISFGAAPFEFF